MCIAGTGVIAGMPDHAGRTGRGLPRERWVVCYLPIAEKQSDDLQTRIRVSVKSACWNYVIRECISTLLLGASKNSEFAQMQGAEKISQRRIWMICKQEIFSATQQLG